MKKNINTVVVLGASGTVGSLVGGLLAQNNLDVWFLSRTLKGSQEGLEKAQKQARSEAICKRVTCADYESMMDEACTKADWIIECVIEDISIKKSLYEKIDACRKKDCVVSTVTSSLPLEELPVGRSNSFKEHFLSTHFYNPPGKMSACEVCGQTETNPAVIDFMVDFLEKRLRRTVIHVKPTAGFAGNRIAFLLFARITKLAVEHGVEMMDYLIGPYTGRIMAPLATLDLVGLDIHRAIIHSLQANTSDAMHEKLVLPDYVEKMIEMGHLGRKACGKGGFYNRLENGKYVYIDPKTLKYISAFEPRVQFVECTKNFIHLGRYNRAFETILQAEGSEAEIVREILATYIAYSYMLVGQVTDEKYGIEGIDHVMTTGFNWAGPSLIVYMLGGKEKAIQLLESQKLQVPQFLRHDTVCEKYLFNAGKYFPAR
jgi:3-hydroxyacyl-CoA dehydrogenase